MKGKRKPRFIVDIDYWQVGELVRYRYTCVSLISVLESLLHVVFEKQHLKIESISILRVGDEKN